MVSTETNRGDTRNERVRISHSIPFVVSNARVEFASSASTDWSFLQAETPGLAVDFYVSCPVSGTLIVEQPNNRTSICYLTSLDSPKYRLAEVLPVAIEKEDDQFIASEPRRGWYGYGESEALAIANFASGLVEELEGLTEQEGNLSPYLLDQLLQIRNVVIVRP